MGDVAGAVARLVALASSIRYAARPERLCLRFISILWLTLLVVVVHATVTDLAAVFRYLEDPVRAPDGRDRAPARRRPEGVVAPGRAGRHLLDAGAARRGRRGLPRVQPDAAGLAGRRYGLIRFLPLGSSSGTPFFSWITISPPSLQEPLIVLPSSVFP